LKIPTPSAIAFTIPPQDKFRVTKVLNPHPILLVRGEWDEVIQLDRLKLGKDVLRAGDTSVIDPIQAVPAGTGRANLDNSSPDLGSGGIDRHCAGGDKVRLLDDVIASKGHLYFRLGRTPGKNPWSQEQEIQDDGDNYK
jgi:hypothetical protein